MRGPPVRPTTGPLRGAPGSIRMAPVLVRLVIVALLVTGLSGLWESSVSPPPLRVASAPEIMPTGVPRGTPGAAVLTTHPPEPMRAPPGSPSCLSPGPLTIDCPFSPASPGIAALPSDPLGWKDATEQVRKSPPPLVWAASAVNDSSGRLFVFGGLGEGGAISNSTWLYANGTWINCTAYFRTNPRPMFGSAMTYDPTVRSLILFGGCLNSACSSESSAIWRLRWPVGWQPISPLLVPSGEGWPAFSYDPALREDLAFGGYQCTVLGQCSVSGTLEAFNATSETWTTLSPSGSVPAARAGADLLWVPDYNTTSGALWLFGGFTGTGALNDTWWYVANSSKPWIPVVPLGAGPVPRSFASATFDPTTSSTILFGGSRCPSFSFCGELLNDTWAFNGSWTNLSSTSGKPPPAALGADLGFGSPPGYGILFGGGMNGDLPSNETWWIYPKLVSEGLTASPSALDVNGSLNMTDSVLGGIPPYSYSWFGLPEPCKALAGGRLQCQPAIAGVYEVSVLVSDEVGDQVSAGPLPITVNSPLTVDANVTPSVGLAPLSVEATVTWRGGTPPVSIRWDFGQGLYSTQADASASYPEVGNYTIALWVNDSGGGTVEKQFRVVVYPPLRLSAQLSSAVVTVGNTTWFNASFSGGVPPVTVTWSVAGQYVGSGTSLPYVAQTPGAFLVLATARDAAGDSQQVSQELQVLPVPTPSPLTLVLTSNVSRGYAPLGVELTLSLESGPTGDYEVYWNENGTNTTSVQTFTVSSFPSQVPHPVELTHPGNYTWSGWVRGPQGQVERTPVVVVEVLPPLPPKPLSSPLEAALGGPVLWILLATAALAVVGAGIWLARRPPRPEEGTTAGEFGTPGGTTVEGTDPRPPWRGKPAVLLEGNDPSVVRPLLRSEGIDPDLVLVVAPERPSGGERELLDFGGTRWRLSRLEREDSLHPADADRLGNLIELHFRRRPGSVVVLLGLDMILESTNIRTLRRLFQVARELAAETGGQFLGFLNPDSMAPADRHRLEEEAYVIRWVSRRMIFRRTL
jgi:hypothetical protein